MTIETSFDASDLPKWAQQNSAVVARCRVDLAFRCDVCAAESKHYQSNLKKQAARWNEQRKEQTK